MQKNVKKKQKKKTGFSRLMYAWSRSVSSRCLVCKDVCQAWKISVQNCGRLGIKQTWGMELSVNTINSVQQKPKWHSHPLTIIPSEHLIHSIQPCNCRCSVYISQLTLLENRHSGVLLLCTCCKWTQLGSPLDGPWHHSLIWERPFGSICISPSIHKAT